MAFVIKFAKAGADVERSADYRLLFSHDSPSLKPIKSVTATVPNMNSQQLILAHNLGYIPAFTVSKVVSGNMYPEESTMADNISILVTKTGVYTKNTGWGSPVTFHVNLYAWELGTDFTSKGKEKFEANPLDGQKYTFRHAKRGQNLGTKDLRNSSVNTTAGRMPLIHLSKQVSMSTGTLDIPHDLGYEPEAMIYKKVTLEDGTTPAYHLFYPFSIIATANNVRVLDPTFLSAYDMAYMILKDYLLET